MKRKLLALVLAAAMVFAMGSVLTGCSNQGGEEKKTLKVLYAATPEVAEKQYLTDTFFKDFEKKHNVEIKVDFMAQADAIKKIQTEQESGKITHDILYVDTANMAPYVNGGWMEDITSIIDGMDVTLTKMYDGTTNKDGKRYFAPMSFDVYVTAAHKDAIQYLPDGLTEEDVVKGITWEQYAQWAVNIAKGEGEGKTMMPANMTGSQLLYPMAGMSLAYGGGFPDFTSQGFKDAAKIMATMAEGNAFYSEQAQYTAPTDPMKSGDVWLTFAHMAPVGVAYNASPNSWVIGSAPKGSAGKGSTSGAWCYGIQKGSENQESAKLFLEYVLTPENNYAFCSNYGGSLSPIEEVGDILKPEDVVMQAGINMLNDTIISGVPSTEYTDWNAVKLLYGDVFDEILKNKAVPSDDFLSGIEGQLNDLKVK